MGRTPNTRIDGELLDKRIKEIEGDKFNMAKISEFVMGNDKTYYRKALLQGNLSNDTLDRVCRYYELDKKDYIITDEKEKQIIQEKADTMNYDNVILLLTGMDKLLREILAQQKSTNYLLGELNTKASNNNKVSKDILQKLEDMEKRDKRGPSYVKR